MALVIACGESSPSHIGLLSCLNRTLDSIKHNIARIFVNILCCQANNARGKDLLPTTYEDFMKKWDENYRLSAQRWFSKKKNSDGEQDPYDSESSLHNSEENQEAMGSAVAPEIVNFIPW